MRILIVGGGIAGLTLAALLRQRGLAPVIVEKTSSYGGVGYVLALWPGGSRILKGLRLYDTLVQRSQPLPRYRACDESGRVLREFDFSRFTAEYGDVLGIPRADLIDVLREGCRDLEIRMSTMAERIDRPGEELAVAFSDGTSGMFDLVVGCDGVRSETREQLFGEVPLRYLGWTGWAWWLDPSLNPSDAITEFWSAGRFLGLYPAKGSLCCFCALPAPREAADPPHERPGKLQEAFAGLGGTVPQVLRQLPSGQEIWHDDFIDLPLRRWSRGRVLLIGDASAAILPSAGIGASVAMESAAALADELSRADAATVELAIRLFERRRRRRVDKVQRESYRLAKLGLVRSRPLAWLRNRLLARMTEERLLKGLKAWLEQPF